MSLSAGARFGKYEVLAKLGEGGMGEVYRARDTRLKRDVAIKVLPDGFATDAERLARFQREAELLASLNHPNIAAIYGIEESRNGESSDAAITALILELIEGETLAERLARGPIRFNDVMAIARQLVEALDAAHGKGVIHRDLKPANIKVTPDDKVKVLDFGLAAVVQNSSGQDVNATQSPTLTLNATRAGVILGTASYMSPEQATGAMADKRADIWAFGVVLWEMLTGRRIFEGETISHTLAFVITKEPDWNTLPAGTPSSIRRLLRRCLEKDRKRRLPDIASAQMEIDDALTAAASEVVSERPAPETTASQLLPVLPWALTAIATTALAIVVALWAPWRTSPALSPVRMISELGVAARVGTGGAPGASLALSPDGTVFAFVAAAGVGVRSQLHVRRIDQLEATALPGTDNARDPFFSPDGAWLAFFADGKLKKVSVTGGAAVPICDAPSGRGGWWAEDGTIAFTPDSNPNMSIFRVSANGGMPEAVTTLATGESLHRWPQVLDSGRAILFTSATNPGSFENGNVIVQTVPEGTRKIVHSGGYFARYLPSGHLLYVNGGTVFVAAFDLARLEVTGPPVPVIKGVESSNGTGAVQLAVSASGTLVYLPGGERSIESAILWMESSGRTSPLREAPSDWSNPSFSPDGNRLAFDAITSGGRPDVWIYDWVRDTPTKVTFDAGVDLRPVWTPDGQRIVFASTRDAANSNLFWQRADGSGGVQRLTDSQRTQFPGSWHVSGKFLAFSELNQSTDILILPVDGDEASGWKIGKPTVFLNGPSVEEDPMFSPDGKWIAYTSNESGQQEVYVRPFPGPGGLQLISNDGGAFPSWSRTREELFFRHPGTQQIMVASYSALGDTFRAEKPRVWSPSRAPARPRQRVYALHPDGKRVAVASAGDPRTTDNSDKVVFVFNFFDELRRLAPASK